MSQNEPVMSQRERFEKICGSFPFCMPMHTYVDGGYRDTDAKRAWAIWQAACPEGWQAVPDTADEKMLSEGVESLTRGQKLFGDNLTQIVSNIHEEMLAAAPKPEDACKSPD